MNGDEWNPQFLTSQATAEGEKGPEQKAGPLLNGQLRDGFKGSHGRAACVVEDKLRRLKGLPDAGITLERLELLFGAEGNKLESSFARRFFKQTGGDHGHAVSASDEFSAQPDEGENITRAAEGKKNDVRHAFDQYGQRKGAV